MFQYMKYIVYRMGRLCGALKAPLFLHGWGWGGVEGGGMGVGGAGGGRGGGVTGVLVRDVDGGGRLGGGVGDGVLSGW